MSPFWLKVIPYTSALASLLRHVDVPFKLMGAGGSAAKYAANELEYASTEELGSASEGLSTEQRERLTASLQEKYMRRQIQKQQERGQPGETGARAAVTGQNDDASVSRNDFDYSSCPSMGAEARNLGEELFKLVDKDESGKISEAEYAAACGTIAKVSPDLLPADFAKLDENRDGEVDRAEWSRRMGAVMQSRGSATFVAECFQSLRAVRDEHGDRSLLHPWIDIDFSSFGQERSVINGADKRGTKKRLTLS